MATISPSKTPVRPYSSMQENDLIKEHMGLVGIVARKFHPVDSHMLEEYLQAGRIGLLKAIRAHDSSRGAFSTVAWNYIRWAILYYIDKERVDPQLSITTDPSGVAYESITDYLPTSLSIKERDVIILRTHGHTFKDIGEIHGLSKSWANHVFHSGVNKIREANV